MSHFKKVCVCGKLIVQCKCMGEKEVQMVYNCRHDYTPLHVTVASKASTNPISLGGLREIMQLFEREYRDVPNLLRVHPSTYNAIREYFMIKEAEEEIMGIPNQEFTPYQQLMGIPLLIDSTLQPGEWKFEKVLKRDV